MAFNDVFIKLLDLTHVMCLVLYERFLATQFKHNAMPDGIKISFITVSPCGDWRAPSDAMGELWLSGAKTIVL